MSEETEKNIDETLQLLVNEIESLKRRFDDHEVQMAPVIEGWKTVQAGRSFIVWIGAPLAVIGGILALFK